MKNDNNYFQFNDAWVFTSLFMYDSKFKKIDLVNIIAYGDALNHSIFEVKELQSAFQKLLKVNLIDIENDSLRLTDVGCNIKAKVINDSVGFFERIDKALRQLNEIDMVNYNTETLRILNLEFLNEEKFEIAFENYKKQ